MPKYRPAPERFWEKVSISSPQNCWLWTASTYQNGYGQFWTGSNLTPAHRYSFFLANGKIPVGKVVMHICDNPLCVNPAHLKLGTQKENVADMLNKGRNGQPTGERQRSAKFTNEQVRQIRRVYESGEHSISKLASIYKVRRIVIENIVLRLTYKDA